MTEPELDPHLRSALARRAEGFRPARDTVEYVLRRAQRRQDHRRAGTAMLVLTLFAATTGFVLPRLLAVDPTTRPSTPTPAPSASDEAGETAPTVFFPTLAREAEGYPDAFATGTLIEEEGCVLLRQEDGSADLVIWPHLWKVERTTSGVLRILDDAGVPVIEVGNDVTLGGGGIGRYPHGPPDRFAEELIGEPIPARCTTENYFPTSGPAEPVPDSLGE